MDDCLFAAQDPADIASALHALRNECKMHLEEEDDVSGFLGVKIEKFDNMMRLTQHGLKDRVIDALQIDDLPAVSTPSNCVLGKDEMGDTPECNFNYASVFTGG